MQKLDKRFVSEIDKKLAAFDANHRNSPAQQAEIDKYARIYALRDNPEGNSTPALTPDWD